jgi:hypothetical protein
VGGLEGMFSIIFGPKSGFMLWIWTWTKLKNYLFRIQHISALLDCHNYYKIILNLVDIKGKKNNQIRILQSGKRYQIGNRGSNFPY